MHGYRLEPSPAPSEFEKKGTCQAACGMWLVQAAFSDTPDWRHRVMKAKKKLYWFLKGYMVSAGRVGVGRA